MNLKIATGLIAVVLLVAAVPLARSDEKDKLKEHGMAKNDTEHGHLKATKLTMVSDTCKK